MKLPYSEGSVFLVRLKEGGFARGVVARATTKGRVLFGYFFGPRLESAGAAEPTGLDPANAIYFARFGDLGLINGEWPLIGTVTNWDRTKWPMPEFVRRDPLSNKAWRVRYWDHDPTQIEAETPTDFTSPLRVNSMLGYGAVEIVLTKMIREA